MTKPDPMVVAGIDVGKSKLDAHILDGSLERRFNNDRCGRRALRNWLFKHGVTRAVLEPTGRYHRNLHQGLFDAGIETVLVNPLRSRRFAQAIGQLAKNDRVDAAMLARFGLLDNLEATPPQPQNLQLLSDLLALRRKLVDQLGALRKLCAELAPEAAGCPGASRAALCWQDRNAALPAPRWRPPYTRGNRRHPSGRPRARPCQPAVDCDVPAGRSGPHARHPGSPVAAEPPQGILRRRE